MIGRGLFAVLEFPLENNHYLEQLADLSNGYIETKDHILKIGITKLENLEEILQTSYIPPEPVCIIYM